ncbi:MAG: lysine--tRNA ligase [Alphaproteobacteria bacterium]|nr:lysine--tRNA ligase [Alphaproteobacteria bacterium]
MTNPAAEAARAWPFEEARKLVKRLEKRDNTKGYALFETGYGPSGLPHIGTFGEVARTSMVRRAFQELSDVPSKLIAFSDDMDGLRRVPDNVPNKEMLEQHLNKPLTEVPDPFGTHSSFGAHNNARLQAFLDTFGFDYEFKSSTEAYKAGEFDEALLAMLHRFDAVMKVILPTLGPDRRATYCPFLPISETTGEVLQVPAEEIRVDAGTMVYRDPVTDQLVETPVTGGHCKLQWKADWAMRWRALDVDYEMSGKDLIDSVKLSSRICRILGGEPPEGFTYELFLDNEGGKISKSKGNGLSVEDWLKYAPPESLALFMFQKPKAAKRLYFDVIPRAVDEYRQHLAKVSELEADKLLESPAWHIHAGAAPEPEGDFSYSLLLNLAAVCNAEEKATLWGFIGRYQPDLTPETAPMLDDLVGYALAYYRDFVKPEKTYRAPTDTERAAMQDMRDRLAVAEEKDASALQNIVYDVGKTHGFENLRAWFQALYEVLLGQSSGPRMGSFIALYGVDETIALMDQALSGEGLAAGG